MTKERCYGAESPTNTMDIVPAGRGKAADALMIGFFPSGSLTFQSGSTHKGGNPTTVPSLPRAKCYTPRCSHLGLFTRLHQLYTCSVDFS